MPSPAPRPLRVFYLLNHQTAMPFEVAILRGLGFEVFVPKRLSQDAITFRSSVVTYEYDQTLSLSPATLDRLNQHNFYDDPISAELKSLIEREFDVAILVASPRVFDDFASFFSGAILLRVYGNSNEYSYGRYFKDVIGPRFSVVLQRLGKRFFFAGAFREIAANEPPHLQERLLWTPLGVPDAFWSNQDTWTGGGQYLLAYIPDLVESPYYRGKHQEFRGLVKGLPYRIMGHQAHPSDDPNVMGYLEQGQIVDTYQRCSAYVYPSEEQRHLHYTPLEAMITGAPVLFNRKGILASMFDGPAPGAYATAEDARRLAKRLLGNDTGLANEIRASQENVLRRQRYDWCLAQWKLAFERDVFPVVEQRRQTTAAAAVAAAPVPMAPDKRPALRLAVILPELYPGGGGTFRGAVNIARMLVMGARAAGQDLDLSFGHVDAPETYQDADFDELRKLGVKIRPFRREKVEAHLLTPMLERLGIARPSPDITHYWNFNDGISNFEDCDFWLIVSDRIQYPIPPHRSYGVVVYDYIQRYVPEIFGVRAESDGNWKMFDAFAQATRDAQFVICTTDQTRRDCINYTGANPDRVFKFPMEFDPLPPADHAVLINQAADPTATAPYLVWTTNSTQHKNHLNVIAGLEMYFRAHPTSKLEVHVTGVYTHLFGSGASQDAHYQDEYPARVRKAIADSRELRNRLRILGNLSEQEYVQQLALAYGVLHGAVYDNGTYSIIEAAWWGVPSISSDYPAIREACANFDVHPILFDPHEPADLARAIEQFVEQHHALGTRLPTVEMLKSRTFSVVAPEYWQAFLNALESTGRSDA